ncbi:MAG: ABA4-like family protein [Pseudomonadota bacterium]
MGWDAVFQVSSTAAMVGWAVLILAPRWPGLMLGPRILIPGALSLAYAAIMMAHLFSVEGGGFGSIEAVRALFASDPVLVGGWQHYLAFDLFVGAWLAQRMDKADIHRVVQTPILIATFMAGPLGFVLGLMVLGGRQGLSRLRGVAA